MKNNSFDEFGKIKAPQEWIDAACAHTAKQRKHNGAAKRVAALAACAAVAATGTWAYFHARQDSPQAPIKPIQGGDTITIESIGGEGGRGDDPTEITTKPDDGKIFFAHSLKIPAADSLNIFAYKQSTAAAELKSTVEKKFGIDSLVSTQNTVDQFFDSRGTDKNGSEAVFQQNTVSGSFTYAVTFTSENAEKYLADYSSINLAAMRPQLEKTATGYAELFEMVTGQLVLKKTEKTESSMQVGEVSATFGCYEFTFVLKSKITVQAAAGLACSETQDGFFRICLRPDGEVISITSTLTNAAMEKCGEEKMFTLAQLQTYLEEEERRNSEGMGGSPNPARTVTACRVVYLNDHTVGKYVPGVVITYYFAGSEDEPFDEFIPVAFVRDGI